MRARVHVGVRAHMCACIILQICVYHSSLVNFSLTVFSQLKLPLVVLIILTIVNVFSSSIAAVCNSA